MRLTTALTGVSGALQGLADELIDSDSPNKTNAAGSHTHQRSMVTSGLVAYPIKVQD